MRKATTIIGLLSLVTVLVVQAQPVRNDVDVLWARDVGEAVMTLDGRTDESVWAQADTYHLVWQNDAELPTALPGSSQRVDGEFLQADPADPNNGMLQVLRKGNDLWLALVVQDKSIGGGRGLQAGNWNFDGVIAAFTDASVYPQAGEEWGRNRFGGGSVISEWIYGWWHPSDTTATGGPVPGIAPYQFGNYGVAWEAPMNTLTAADSAVWSAVTTVDGTANDDTHGEDVGYTMEWRISLDSLGYDMTQVGGDKISFGFALQDADYMWSGEVDDRRFTSRVWLQNQWANNYNDGIAYIYGRPGVTVNSGALPQLIEPEFRVPNVNDLAAPTVDGMLDDAAWQASEPVFALQYQPSEEVRSMNPEVAQNLYFFFRPNIDGGGEDDDPPLLDPSVARFHMLNDMTHLYIGVDVEDQAVSGQVLNFDRRDGFRIGLRRPDSTKSLGNTLAQENLDFVIDSTGAVQLVGNAARINEAHPGAIQAAASLKGESTAGDPTDVDEGYQIEVMLDLEAVLGYPVGSEGLEERRIWILLNYQDGDDLEDEATSTATRTWLVGEGGGPDAASLYGYLNASSVVSNETENGRSRNVVLKGNAPNPFGSASQLRYELPYAGQVIVRVYDALGRQVAVYSEGLKGAGTNALRLDAARFASGVYMYRVEVNGVGGASSTASGRMTVVR